MLRLLGLLQVLRLLLERGAVLRNLPAKGLNLEVCRAPADRPRFASPGAAARSDLATRAEGKNRIPERSP